MNSHPPLNDCCSIVLVDDHAIVRHAIKTILEGAGHYQVVGESDSCAGGLKLVQDLSPEIAIVDLGLPGKSGLELLMDLKQLNLRTKVVVVTMYEDEQRFTHALHAGALAYLPKNLPPQEFLTALQKVRTGERYVPARLAHLEKALGETNSESSSDPLARLSKREREIFFFLAEGLPNRTIAKKLFISPRTVETHRARVLKKFGFLSTAELIRFALRNHLLSA